MTFKPKQGKKLDITHCDKPIQEVGSTSLAAADSCRILDASNATGSFNVSHNLFSSASFVPVQGTKVSLRAGSSAHHAKVQSQASHALSSGRPDLLNRTNIPGVSFQLSALMFVEIASDVVSEEEDGAEGAAEGEEMSSILTCGL